MSKRMQETLDLETVDNFCFLYWLARYLKHKDVFVLAICRARSHFTETQILWSEIARSVHAMYQEKCDWFSNMH